MRQPRALLPLRLALTLLLTHIAYASLQTQKYLLCKQPGSQNCLSWMINLDQIRNSPNVLSAATNIGTYCGLSDLHDVGTQRKYIQIEQQNEISSIKKTIFCKKIISMKLFLDWKEVADTLGFSIRVRRQSFAPRGKYRGQTQSQYLAIDRGNGKDEGKAEAHSAADSSRASVSGNSGMGQAQSQSVYDPNCDDCNGKSNNEVENLRRSNGFIPGNSGHGPDADTTWTDKDGKGPIHTPNGSLNQIDTNRYTPGPFRPTQGSGYIQPGPGAKDNTIYGPHGTRVVGPSNIGDGNYGPSSITSDGYSPGNLQIGTGYRPIDTQGGSSYIPKGSYIPTANTNGPKLGNEDNSNTRGYNPIGTIAGSSVPGTNVASIGYNTPNGEGTAYDGTYEPGKNLRGTDFSMYKPQRSNDNTYIPEQNLNKYGLKPESIPTAIENSIPGYSPETHNSGLGLTPYRPDGGTSGDNPSGFGTRQSGATNWPVASGPYSGPGGSNVYCCVIPNTGQTFTPYGNLFPTVTGTQVGSPGGHHNGNMGGISGTTAPESNYGPGGNTAPEGQYGIGGATGPGRQYGPRGTIEPGGQVGNGGTIGSGGYYGLGDATGPRGQYGPVGATGPGGQYESGGTTRPGGQYGPGGTTGPRGQYGPGGIHGLGVQYGPGGATGPGGQYGPGGTTLPGRQYIPGGTTGPEGQYIPGGTTGSGSNFGPGRNTDLGAQYGPGGNTGSGRQYGPGGTAGTREQYGPGGTTGQGGQLEPDRPTGSGGQYGPGGAIGSGGQYGPGGAIGSGGQYIPGGTPVSGGQYGQGGTIGPGGQYGQGGTIGPGGQYGTGGTTGPGIQYGSGGTTGPGRQYGPGVMTGSGGQYRPEGTTGPGGQYGIGGTTVPEQHGPGGTTGPGGQYGPGGTTGTAGRYGPGGTTGTGGQYGPGGSTGTGAQYGPGGTTGTGGQYGPGGTTGTGGQYGPGGTTGPGGQYGPGGTTSPGGQYGPGGTIGPGGQYGHGGTSGPGGKYGPGGATGPGGQYGPGGTVDPGGQYGPVGSTGNGGQYGPRESNGPGGQYGPVGSTGNGGQYGPRESNGPGGQYGPGGTTGTEGQYGPGIQYGQGGVTGPGGQYGPGGTPSYGYYNQGGTGPQNNEFNGVPQNYVDPNSIIADGDDSGAEASVAQNLNGTTASASAKGGNDKGRAQTNVQGTYTGSGSFQAQAQITGENKEAQSEVSGGKKGASSSASGSGRNNKSQANVQLGSETGSVQTQSQSNGVMHSSNSQVQGSVKGGMADAQARGPGSTSSQAQIGFTPYKDEEKNSHDLQKIPFMGGGMASAQSSGRTGQSQSQLHGTFKYGITYNGAAQSGASLDKDAVFPNKLSFEKIDVFDENEKNINVDRIDMDATETPQSLVTELVPPDTSTIIGSINGEKIDNEIPNNTTENVIDETMKNSETRYTGNTQSNNHNSESFNTTDQYGPTLTGSRRSFQTNYAIPPEYEFTTDKDDNQPEYDTDVGFDGDGNEVNDVEQPEYSNYDEYSRDSPTHQYLQTPSRKGIDVQQTTGGNTQHIVLSSLKNHNAEIIQKDSDRPDETKVYQPGERIPGTGGYTIPAGFTGNVKSVASKDNTYVIGSKDSPSQAQTVTLTPGTGKVRYTHPYRNYVKPKNLRSLHNPKENDNRYVSVSKSVTRALDSDNNIRKQYSHTYYTKSSSCGYFTFTCTMVSSAEGRKKVCKPKMPTNPDGTPIRC